jgi:hypothetical protein
MIKVSQILILFFIPFMMKAQDKFELNGYLSDMQTIIFRDFEKEWTIDNLIHNRMNFFWYPMDNLTGTVQFRNRFMYGDNFRMNPGYASSFNKDNGYIDATENIIDGSMYALNTSVDRFWFQYTLGSFEVKAGRQRINWGHTFVWNPNDIFNAYSFFDIDYPERPGSDALRLTYYTGMTSSIEAAMKMNHKEEITAAALWRFNQWNYDFQLMAGIVNEQDYVAGGGWSGYIKGLSIRGEGSYFRPMENFEDTTGTVSVSISADYTFSNSLYLQAEALYDEQPGKGGISSFNDFYGLSLSAKNLSFTEFNYFAQASYPINPLLNGGLAVIYYPEFKGYYIGPNISYSLRDDMDLSFYLQSFSGEFKQQVMNTTIKKRIDFNLAFIRFKWSF